MLQGRWGILLPVRSRDQAILLPTYLPRYRCRMMVVLHGHVYISQLSTDLDSLWGKCIVCWFFEHGVDGSGFNTCSATYLLSTIQGIWACGGIYLGTY